MSHRFLTAALDHFAPWVLMALVACAGCSQQKSSAAAQTPKRLLVFAGIPPLAFLAEQIGGEQVDVGVLVHAGQDPHTFEPSPHQILALSKAKLFFTIGMPFERTLLAKIQESHSRLLVVDVTKGIPKRTMEHSCNEDADHEAHHETNPAHAGEPDPHVWLSPPLLKQIANNIAKAFETTDPENARTYEKNLDALLKQIDAVHANIAKTLKPYEGGAFYVFHPGFGYFADAFGMKQIAVEAGGRSPTPKEIQQWIEDARKNHVRVIFIQPQSPQQSAQVIAEAIGGKCVTIDGLAKNPLLDMEDIASKMDAAQKER